ncbi:macrophage migration inhibitory factor-like [Acanthaster planci]|uniref:D-dopachrome decarboxylase n=1 Tax=Acanthaster planci TaxID=133434 RepID=A0A8B7Y2A3_ACAPL|nr:macrophage migration inhibitory factor-like [Acanthaster planci]XP_022086430.1 macrophage migration inhibitory factor-like [Acanthaster planci]
MPFCELSTSVPKAKVDESFLKEFSQLLASIIGRPERRVTIQVNPDQIMMKAGSMEPVAVTEIHGNNPDYFTDAMREKWVASLTSFLSDKLGITDHGRIIVSFHQKEPTHVGIFGKLISQRHSE